MDVMFMWIAAGMGLGLLANLAIDKIRQPEP